MNPPLPNEQIQHFAEVALATVLQEQLGITTTLVGQGEAYKPKSSGPGQPRLVGAVGLAGELQAVVCLNVSHTFAVRISSEMFGMSDEEVTDEEINDALGEVTNMVTGEIRRKVFDVSRLDCAIGLPTITRGDQLDIETVSQATCVFATFETESERLFLEVCLPVSNHHHHPHHSRSSHKTEHPSTSRIS